MLNIIPAQYFELYQKVQPITIEKHLKKIRNRPLDFGYSIVYSAVYSSQLEGNLLDIDTYFKFSKTGMNTKTKSFLEIKNLENAYFFAQKKSINEKNTLKAHKILSSDVILENKYQGKYRDKNVYVMAGKDVVYTAIEPEKIQEEMDKFFNDILSLVEEKLTIDEVFYYASFIHLIFVLIHPFADGNGRTARLLEKWFLAHKIGEIAWHIPTEYLYLRRLKSYRNNIRKLGNNFKNINFSKSISFLKMLPMALKLNNY